MKKSGLADSPFFTPPSPVVPPQEAASEKVSAAKSERNNERTIFRSEKRTVSLPMKRRKRRYSFELYEDQITQIKRLKYEAEMAGERLFLSDIVCQALDAYFQNKAI